MGKTLTPERQILKQWAIELASVGLTQEMIGKHLGVPRNCLKEWVKALKINAKCPCINDINGEIVANSGLIVANFHDGHPPHPKPKLYVAPAQDLHYLSDKTVDIIITSPPYNLGQEKWPMGGGGRASRNGIEYATHEDSMSEEAYQEWQIAVFRELYRVAKPGASFFYNHKVRQVDGTIIHPVSWLLNSSNPWTLRQEIIWDRVSTHNHTPTLFYPIDERIYWMTKGKPNLGDSSIGMPSVWKQFGPTPNTGHPAPFSPALPHMILKAIGKPGDVILDPFGGGMTTCVVAHALGYHSYGSDIAEEYVERAKIHFSK